MSPTSRRPLTRAAAAAPVYQLKITLAEVEPPIWRRIRARGDLRLDRLHTVFQRVMGHYEVDEVPGGRARLSPRGLRRCGSLR